MPSSSAEALEPPVGHALVHRIVARAATTHERSGPGFEVVPVDASRLLERERQVIDLAARGDAELYEHLLRWRGLDREAHRARLTDVRVARPDALPEWARVLGAWIESKPPPATSLEPPLDVFLPLLGEAAVVVERLPRTIRLGLLMALVTRWAHVLAPTLGAPASPIDALVLSGDRAGATIQESYFEHGAADLHRWFRLFDEYPGLARAMAILFVHWRDATERFLGRLERDMERIQREFFGGRDVGALTALECHLGDAHAGGDAVRLLTFASGDRLVYKPRALALAAQFQTLIEKINTIGGLPSLHHRHVLCADGYTWEEYVPVRPCIDADQVSQYFVRLGMLARIAKALNSRDCHFENVLAHGDQPVIVDVETIVYPFLAAEPEEFRLANSSLLHGHIFGALGHRPIEVGVLGGGREQALPISTPAVAPAVQPPADSIPKLDGRYACPADHFGSIEEGYLAMSKWLARHGPALVPLVRDMSGSHFRFLYRATQIYGRLLLSSCSPSAMRDGLARDAVLDQLWLASLANGHPGEIVRSEIQALRKMDIPMFLGRLDDDGLHCEDGSTVNGHFRRDCTEAVCGQLLGDDEHGIEELRTILHCVAPNVRPDDVGSPTPRPPSSWLDAAREAGRWLLAEPGRPDWELIYVPWADAFRLLPGGAELLSGVAGRAVVCAQIAAATGDVEFREVAERSAERIRNGLRKLPELYSRLRRRGAKPLFLGAHFGLGSRLYAALRSGTLLEDQRLVAEAVDAARSLPIERLFWQAPVDFRTGSAGLLSSLCLASEIEPRLVPNAIELGNLLLDRNEPPPVPEGSTFLDGLPDPLLGRSLAFHRLWQRTQLPEFDLPWQAPGATTGAGLVAVSLGGPWPNDMGSVGPLDEIELHLAAFRVARDRTHLERARAAGERLWGRFLETGTWFPGRLASDRHDLCALTGVGAVAYAFLRLCDPAIPSLRLAEGWTSSG